MTKGKAVGLAVAASVAVTSLVWIGVLAALSSVTRTSRWSDVVPSMGLVIQDLAQAADQGRNDDVKRKLDLLSARWEAFRAGGEAPSGFFMEIVAVGKTGRTGWTEPSDGSDAATPSEGEARETE